MALKEFCSACKKMYEIPQGVWRPCPLCDGLGRDLTEKEKKKREEALSLLNIPLRERWDLKLR